MLKAPAALAAVASVWLIATGAHAAPPDVAPPPASQEPTPAAPAAPPEAATVAGSELGAAARARRIQVLIAAEPDQRERFARVVHELMARLSVAVELTAIERVELAVVLADRPAQPPYLARCYVDLRKRERALLFVHDPARDRILERRIERAPGDDELAREQLGHMLLAAIEGLLSGATLGAPRSEIVAALPAADQPPRAEQEAEPEPDLEPPPEPGRGEWSLRGGLLYEVAALGHGPGLAHGPALAVLIRSPLSRQLGMLLGALYRWPFDVEGDGNPVGMRVHAVGLRALATLETPLGARMVLRAGVGGGADVARIAPESRAAGTVRASAARTLTLAVARALLAADFRLSPQLALWVALSADLDLDRAQYVLVRSDGSEAELSAPWRLRPALSIGLVLP
jgi:hypothetical protein